MSRNTARISFFASLALAAMLLSASPAGATPISLGYSLRISEALPGGSVATPLLSTRTLVAADRPMFQLSNTSEGADIIGFQITMGDTAYSFGSLIFVPQAFPITVTDFTPIATPGGHAGAEVAGISFNNFSEGETFSFRADIDRNSDHGASLTNYRQALAGGPNKASWAKIDVSFSDGTTLSKTLTPADVSGGSADGSYSFFYCLRNPQPQGQINVNQEYTPVPEPTTLALAGFGALGLLFSARRLRQRGQLRAS